MILYFFPSFSPPRPFQIHSFLFLAVVVVLLVNLLIAMMGDTYTKIAEIKNEWMRQVGVKGIVT